MKDGRNNLDTFKKNTHTVKNCSVTLGLMGKGSKERKLFYKGSKYWLDFSYLLPK